MAIMSSNIAPRDARIQRRLALGLAALLVLGLSGWGTSYIVTPRATPLDQVVEIVADLEAAQRSAAVDADSYIEFLRDRNLPGIFDYESTSWVLAENFYRAHWDVNNLRTSSGWFNPDLETLTPSPEWVLPDTECSVETVPGDQRGVEVFSVRDRANPGVVHYVAIKNQVGYVFSPLCNFTPATRISEARAALEAHLALEAQAKQQGPRAYFEFVRSTNYPNLYDTTTSRWRLGEAILEEVWDLNEVYRTDERDLDSIGILDLRLSQGDEGCAPSRTSVPAALWVVTTPAQGGEPYAEYFHYHEGRLSGFVALCDIKVSINEQGEIVLSAYSSGG